ncbi:MAG: heparan-alpha-glucosaminide N-acetyltransferase domain-containing protein, partial [Bacteroidota bacterium]
QGHFIDGLLNPMYKDNSVLLFNIWKYFRGITAPTFFTVAGFIFMYLLIKQDTHIGWKNPRVQKGIKRGVMLIGIGYLLRLNFSGLFIGEIYESFYQIDVLHCIGVAILLLTFIYLLSHSRKKYLMPALLLSIGMLIFLSEPYYAHLRFSTLPKMLANYFTKANGSIFTLLPWFGYAAFGAFAALGFHNYKTHKHLYRYAIGIGLLGGFILIYLSSPFFWKLYQLFEIPLALRLVENNYLFIRLGNVLVLFAVFMSLRNVITSKTIRIIGQRTLSIYVIHFIILYGSFTTLGLYPFFKHTLNPYMAISGALVFISIVTYISFTYHTIKPTIPEKTKQIPMVLHRIKAKLTVLFRMVKNQ